MKGNILTTGHNHLFFWKWLFMPSSVSTHNTQQTHHTHNTHITQLNLTDGYMDLTYSHKLSCELWFNNKCMSKEKLVVVWIYSMLLIYSFTLWSHCGGSLQWKKKIILQFWLINYWIVIINILIYLTNMIWEKVVQYITHIYARDVKKGEDHTYCYSFRKSSATFSL